jgi:hypothetical protein
MASSRRRFLTATGAGIIGLGSANLLKAQPGIETNAALTALIATMRARVKQIRTFYIACDLHIPGNGADWSKEDRVLTTGSTEIAFDGHTLAAIHRRNGLTITEIEKADHFRQLVDYDQQLAPRRVLYDGPRGGDHRVKFSLRQFLPVPADDVLEEGAPVLIHGRSAHRVATQRVRLYVDDDARVQRLERLHPHTTALIETIDFDNFSFPLAGVPFPMTMTSQFPHRSPLTTAVSRIEINATVPRQLPGVE